MLKKFLSLAIAACTATVSVAAPRETAYFTAVESVGLMGNPANQVRRFTFAGADSFGTYTAKYLTISGELFDSFGTSSWAREAVIEVTPPGGQSFVCAPTNVMSYVGVLPIEPGRYVVPIGQFNTAGEWTFRFAETYDDDPNGTDQQWVTVSFTLNDSPPPPVTTPGGLAATFTDVPSDGVMGSGTIRTMTVAETGNVNKIQVVGRITTKSLVSADNLYNVPNQTRLRVTPPASTGLEPFEVNLNLGGVSTATTSVTLDLPGAPTSGVSAAGVWTYEFYEAVDEPGVVDAVWQTVSVVLQSSNPPASTSVRELVDGGTSVSDDDFTVTNTTVPPGTVRWLRFELPRDIGPTNDAALDIDMVGTNASPQNDYSLALYTSAGQRLAYSYDTGPGMLPQISLGRGTRTRNGNGLPYVGVNTDLSPGGSVSATAWPATLTGTHYIALCAGDDGASFGGNLWSVTPSTEANGPGASVRIRYYTHAPSVVPPSAVVQNLGTLAGSVGGTVSLPADPGARFKWLRFTLTSTVDAAGGKFIDIDTANTLSPNNDTNIALYNSAGALVASSNDIVPGWGAGNPSGANSALSFGDAQLLRNYSSLNANMPAGNGRDGTLAPDVYYLQISTCCAGYGPDRFWVVNDFVTHTQPGDILWNIHNNLGFICGPSDVGQQGGLPGNDNRLDNNDFIVFIENYFLQVPVSDVGSQGGLPGSDGLFDNNDFIVFINNYFNAPASCR